MTGRPVDVQAAFCAVLCDEWARAGVTDAVVAPGSRSTPMVVALDAEPRIRVTVVLDERSAGFTALGIGLATGRPAVVVTTSGTASVELHPAVVEAGQAFVPLIAVTTDRPPELHQVAAPQTVEQTGLFGPAVRWAFDPGVAEPGGAGMWRSLAARAVAEAVAGPAGPGPVQLNLPFREPLLGDPAAFVTPPGRPDGSPWHTVGSQPPGLPDRATVEQIARLAGRRGLIVAGAGDPAAAPAVLGLAARLGWPVLADPRSGCRVPSPWVVSSADPLLRCPSFSQEVPEAVLRIGPPWASKVVNTWLAGLPAGVPQILLDPRDRWADPERRATHVTRTSPAGLLAALEGAAEPDHEWAALWQMGERSARSAIDRLIGPGGPLELSEPGVAHAALHALAAGGTLIASSSMPVRDVEWYGPPLAGATVLANRGANGIDGVVATAIGVAMARPDTPTVGLLGDLAFLYDVGSLLWAGRRPGRLRLVVVDNDGGGIFSFLSQAAAMPAARFERYWGTPHGLDLVALARAYRVDAEPVETRSALDRWLTEESGDGDGLRVAVVRSDRSANVAAHDRIHAAVASAASTPPG
jgi:2-succinyl-5-enolpyruvyl-6-hydroxy-3-cyclohexene-1-carboxylate synthase